MKKWELELENENLKKNCKMLMNEKGRVYAWQPLPALPEVR